MAKKIRLIFFFEIPNQIHFTVFQWNDNNYYCHSVELIWFQTHHQASNSQSVLAFFFIKVVIRRKDPVTRCSIYKS